MIPGDQDARGEEREGEGGREVPTCQIVQQNDDSVYHQDARNDLLMDTSELFIALLTRKQSCMKERRWEE